jgi:hypothetical protein
MFCSLVPGVWFSGPCDLDPLARMPPSPASQSWSKYPSISTDHFRLRPALERNGGVRCRLEQ